MFAYFNQDSFLHRRNPIIKLSIVFCLSILLSLSYYPVLPIVTFLIAFVSIYFMGKIPLKKLLSSMKIFICVSLIFMISMFILKGFGNKTDVVLSFGILSWRKVDLTHVLTLGFRILAFATLSLGFVLTTKPRDLGLSLIMQCKVSPLHAYSALAAYRFLPELQSQVEDIKLAHEIRGMEWNKNLATRFSSPFKTILPLMSCAIRRGERLACAMESRGLGYSKNRSYYTKLKVNKYDYWFLAITLLLYFAIIAVCIHYNVFNYSFAFVK